MITGTTENSRLIELRKYVVTDDFNSQYFGDGSSTSDGVDYNSSDENNVVYYLGGIRYVDVITSTGTEISFSYEPNNEGNFNDGLNYQNPNKEGIISNPKINDDVFIDRGELSAFDMNYRFEYIDSLYDITTYAGGKYFTIINNT